MIDLSWGSATDCGPVRSHNEDAILAASPIFLVADGVGGRVGGAVASAIVCAGFEELAGLSVTSTEAVQETVQRTNNAIVERARVDTACAGMATTMVGLALVEECGEPHWLAFNVGDSRIYRMSRGALEQLSVDHSEVQELVDAGTIAESARHGHESGHVITRSMGTDPAPMADYWLLSPVSGERFLLCSDGLTGRLADADVQRLLDRPAPAQETARELVAAALAAGTQDNVSVVVIDVLASAGPDDPASTNPREGGDAP